MVEKNKIIQDIRMRGAGKTPTIVGAPEHNVPSLAQIYIRKGMKAIVIDSEDHPAYRPHVTNISPGQNINDLPAGFYRIYGTNYPAMFGAINNIWNSLLIYEDPKKYMGTQLDKDTRAVVTATKNRNCDSIMMWQSWGWCIRELFPISDGINIGKTGDSPEIRKDVLLTDYEKVFKVWQEVMAQPNKYLHKYVAINQ